MTLLLSLALLILATPASDLTVGPPGSGAQFSSIQAAIDVAGSGDRVFVAAGTYTEKLWIDKPIQVNGAGSGLTTLVGVPLGNCAPTSLQATLLCNPATVEIRDVPAGGLVRLVGMKIARPAHTVNFGFSFYTGGAVTIASSASPVELNDLELNDLELSSIPSVLGIELQISGPSSVTAVAVRNTRPVSSKIGYPAVAIGPSFLVPAGGATATFVDCSFTAHDGTLLASSQALAPSAMRVQDSTVHLADTHLEGGGQVLVLANLVGGPGLSLFQSEAVVYGGSVLKGESTQQCWSPQLPCVAGSGVALVGGSKLTYSQDARILGGTTPSTSAPDISAEPGTIVIALQRRLPTLVIQPAAASPGAALQIRATGEPAALLVRGLALGTAPGVSVGSALTKLVLDPISQALFPAISVPTSGVVTLQSQLPPTSAAIGLTVFEQLLQVSPGGVVDLSPAAAVSVLP